MHNVSRFLTAFFIPVVLNGCLEYGTTTTVNPDGSILREVTVKGDSAGVHGWSFHIPVDSTWTTLSREKLREDTWMLTTRRTFESPEDWGRFQDAIPRRVLRSDITIERRFLVFTTTYSYEEKIRCFNPFTAVPLTDFLSPAELEAFLRFEVYKESFPTRGDSLAHEDAGDRFQAWETESRFASYFSTIIAGLPQGSKLLADSSRLAAVRQSMRESFADNGTDSNAVFQNPDDVHLRAWVRRTGERDLLTALDRQHQALLALRKDVDFIQSVLADSYKSSVSLPGEIVSSNSTKTEEGHPVWDDYIAYAYVSDFTMRAESRVINIWLLLLVLAVLVAAPMLVLVARGVRNRRRTLAV